MPAPASLLTLPADYGTFLVAIKARIAQERLKALLSASAMQVMMYWDLGKLEKLKDTQLRVWYAEQTIKNGWSKDILAIQIDSALHFRVGQSANNFALTLPPLDSDMANQIFKDPYLFDFLGTAQVRKEAELENKLIEHLEKFLLELGQGFAFVGRQVPVEVGGSDFYIDMLFYHLKLRCYVLRRTSEPVDHVYEYCQ